MGIIVSFERPRIDTHSFRVVQPEFHADTKRKRSSAAEALKNIDDIIRIQEYIRYERPYKHEEIRSRDYLMFTMGINFGLRCGDLMKLRVGHVITPDGKCRDKVVLQEEKTDKYRTVYMNDEVIDALLWYLAGKEVDLDDYLFGSYSHNDSKAYYDRLAEKSYKARGGEKSGLSVDNAGKILKKIINDELQIPVHASTHCMRKTFGYQVVMSFPDRTRAVEHLQKIFGHSSPAITMRYIGITDDEIRDTYQNLNLGHLHFAQSAGLAGIA